MMWAIWVALDSMVSLKSFRLLLKVSLQTTLDLALEWLNIKFARAFEDIKTNSLSHSPVCHLNSSATFWEVFIWLFFFF